MYVRDSILTNLKNLSLLSLIRARIRQCFKGGIIAIHRICGCDIIYDLFVEEEWQKTHEQIKISVLSILYQGQEKEQLYYNKRAIEEEESEV